MPQQLFLIPTLRRSWKRIQRISARGLAAGAIALLVIGGSVQSQAPGWAQATASQPTSGSTAETPTAQPSTPPQINLDLPPEINQFLTTNWADRITQRTIWLDGRPILQIAVREGGEGSSPDNSIDLRARTIEKRLQSVVTADFDPSSLNVFVEELNALPVIRAAFEVDGRRQTSELLTVTSLDATVNQTASPETLANEWMDTLEQALILAIEERQPEFIAQQSRYALGIFGGMLLLSLIISLMQRRIRVERKNLDKEAEYQAQQAVRASDRFGDQTTPSTTLLTRQRIAHQQQRSVNDLKRRVGQLAQVVVWVMGFYGILGLFPHSRWLQPLILDLILQIPGKICLILLATYVTIRLSNVLIDRFFWILQSGSRFSPERSQRRALRFSTFSTVTKGVVAFIIALTGGVTILSIFGVNVAPLVAGAGILGLGVSFAAQNLIKDIINGFLILIEDQYGVGDVVILGDVSGFVEYMGLRITQLRNEEGRLITVPNSAITVVQNLTKEWSRVDLLIEVDYSADIDLAIALIKRVAQEMSESPQWKDLILEPPVLLGVDTFGPAGAGIRLWIKTQPLKQWDVGRELRRRLKITFDQAGIAIGVPQQSLRFNTSLDVNTPPDEQNGHHHYSDRSTPDEDRETPAEL